MTAPVGKYVKVDLTLEECRAVQLLCEMSSALMREMGSHVGQTERERVQTVMNGIRYKMGISEELLAPGSTASPQILTLLDKQTQKRLRS